MRLQDPLDALVSEKLILLIEGLRNAVRVQETNITLLQNDAARRVAHIREDAHGGAADVVKNPHGPVEADYQRRAMPAVGVVERSRRRIEQADKEGDEHAVGIVRLQHGVDAGHGLVRAQPVLHHVADQRHGHGHEQGRRNALA